MGVGTIWFKEALLIIFKIIILGSEKKDKDIYIFQQSKTNCSLSVGAEIPVGTFCDALLLSKQIESSFFIVSLPLF